MDAGALAFGSDMPERRLHDDPKDGSVWPRWPIYHDRNSFMRNETLEVLQSIVSIRLDS